ncbi:hypothetical protein KGM_200500 [Danaus plexippus plexippus]|uniref:Uncharacterized protein n=1 Tax=Danaus plexippus plexippus TaxID=278856 RepID=A0A212EVC4_DANPL|nr:hypothetical protein KGM_200500 [Danaus plexippus plexippus]
MGASLKFSNIKENLSKMKFLYTLLLISALMALSFAKPNMFDDIIHQAQDAFINRTEGFMKMSENLTGMKT